MIEFITYWVYRFINILLAPFFFHFSQQWLFMEIVLIVNNVVDTIGLFYIMLLFISSALFFRNATFQSFCKNIFKNYFSFSNVIVLLNYFSSFFKNFFKISFSLIKSLFSFFFRK